MTTTKDREIFKISKKSICHNCKFLDRKCKNLNLFMYCGTDSKEKLAFVSRCSGYLEKKKE